MVYCKSSRDDFIFLRTSISRLPTISFLYRAINGRVQSSLTSDVNFLQADKDTPYVSANTSGISHAAYTYEEQKFNSNKQV